MILNLSRCRDEYKNCHALNQRDWESKNICWSETTAKRSTPTNQITKIAITLPFLFLSGFFTGMAFIMYIDAL